MNRLERHALRDEWKKNFEEKYKALLLEEVVEILLERFQNELTPPLFIQFEFQHDMCDLYGDGINIEHVLLFGEEGNPTKLDYEQSKKMYYSLENHLLNNNWDDEKIKFFLWGEKIRLK